MYLRRQGLIRLERCKQLPILFSLCSHETKVNLAHSSPGAQTTRDTFLNNEGFVFIQREIRFYVKSTTPFPTNTNEKDRYYLYDFAVLPVIMRVPCPREAERRVGEVEASFKKQLRAAQERNRCAGLSTERRLREEGELAQRLSSRNTDLQVWTTQLGMPRCRGRA